MRPLTSSSRFTLILAMLVPCLALLWLTAVPNTLAPLSYVIVAGLSTALAIVGAITYNNAQATSSVAQVLHEADGGSSSSARGVRRTAPRERPSV